MSIACNVIFASLLGLVLGSFYACYCMRYIAVSPVQGARSCCPKCLKKLRIQDIIPVFSYFWLRRRCGYCQKPIDSLYVFVESFSAVLAVVIMWQTGLSPAFFVYLVAFGVMLVASIIDYYTFILPNACTLGATVFFMMLSVFFDVLPLSHVIYGALASGGVAGLLYVYFISIRKKQALGLGDVKYLFFLGALVGVEGLPTMYFTASSLGILYLMFLRLQHGKAYRLWQTSIPFGPFLSGGAFVAWFLTQQGYIATILWTR